MLIKPRSSQYRKSCTSKMSDQQEEPSGASSPAILKDDEPSQPDDQVIIVITIACFMYHLEKRDAPEASDPLHFISYLRPGIEDFFNRKGEIPHSPIWFEVATLQFTPLCLEFEAFLHERFGLTRDDTCRWVSRVLYIHSGLVYWLLTW